MQQLLGLAHAGGSRQAAGRGRGAKFLKGIGGRQRAIISFSRSFCWAKILAPNWRHCIRLYCAELRCFRFHLVTNVPCANIRLACQALAPPTARVYMYLNVPTVVGREVRAVNVHD
jgi:hypothetical protein